MESYCFRCSSYKILPLGEKRRRSTSKFPPLITWEHRTLSWSKSVITNYSAFAVPTQSRWRLTTVMSCIRWQSLLSCHTQGDNLYCYVMHKVTVIAVMSPTTVTQHRDAEQAEPWEGVNTWNIHRISAILNQHVDPWLPITSNFCQCYVRTCNFWLFQQILDQLGSGKWPCMTVLTLLAWVLRYYSLDVIRFCLSC